MDDVVTEDKKYELVDNPVSWLILTGMAGFLLAILILGGKCTCGGKVRYNSIVLSKKDSFVRSIFNDRLGLLRDTIDKMEKDTAKFAKLIPPALKSLYATQRELIQFNTGNEDTSIKYFTKLLTVNRDTLSTAITDPAWTLDTSYRRKVTFHVIDTTPSLFHSASDSIKVIELKRTPPGHLMDFFGNNSMSGLWFIFSIAQMTLWFLVIGLMVAAQQKLQDTPHVEIRKFLSVPSWLICSILPTLFFAIFGGIFYFFLVDTTVIKDHFFLEGFNSKMVLYAFFGYLAAISCFGMYLLTSLALDKVNVAFNSANKTSEEDSNLTKCFQLLKKTFENSFLATAIILSAFVLWTGIMFQAINQTEAMSFYTAYSGKDFLSYDYVYLIGAIHTIILLLFYIPVRIKFNSMEITGEDAKKSSDQTGTKIVGNLFDSLGTVLVTASPLLVSLFQKIFMGLIGN